MGHREDGDTVRVTVTAAGRVNLIGDHVDYMGGPVLPMAIDLGTTIEATAGGERIRLASDVEPSSLELALPVGDCAMVEPPWGRYVAAVAAELSATRGLTGSITTSIPMGAGLSSSAALEVAAAVALGSTTGAGDPHWPDGFGRTQLALLCQRAEHAAVGVPSGIMDQLAITCGNAGSATLIDCATLEVTPVGVPPDAAIWVVHSGESRRLEGSGYAQRRQSAEAAADLIGPLRSADRSDIESIGDPVLRRRARHVRTECARVIEFARAFEAGDLRAAGELMAASHRSLRDDYEVSTPRLDELVAALCVMDGVHGARLTGAGFGGCVVAVADPPVDLLATPLAAHGAWRVTPSDGIALTLDPPAN